MRGKVEREGGDREEEEKGEVEMGECGGTGVEGEEGVEEGEVVGCWAMWQKVQARRLPWLSLFTPFDVRGPLQQPRKRRH